MNNTKTLAIVAVLTAATLVLGGTLAATTTTTPAFAAKRDNGKRNDNTDPDTIQKCKQFASGFDPTFGDQNCDILSNSNISEAAAVTPPVTPPEEAGCPAGTLYNVVLDDPLLDGTIIPDNTILCLVKKLGNQQATISTDTPVTGVTTVQVTVAQANATPCNTQGSNSGFVHATVESGDPGNSGGEPITTVCVKKT